jgi:hypothetical protein
MRGNGRDESVVPEVCRSAKPGHRIANESLVLARNALETIILSDPQHLRNSISLTERRLARIICGH